VATAVGLFASTEISLQRVLLSPVSQNFKIVLIILFTIKSKILVDLTFFLASQVLQLMNDSNQSVREAAISCIEVS
jgi:CLIP-associating protein 1/2